VFRVDSPSIHDGHIRDSKFEYVAHLTNKISVTFYLELEFVPTPTACCAASIKPRTETILDIVPHYLIGQSVSDTGRPGQK